MDVANARVLLADIKDCAVRAGIYHSWFLSFGTLLGAVRPTKRTMPDGSVSYVQGLMQHDDDMDIGLFAENISEEQEEHYYALLKEKGCFTVREREERRADTNRRLWFTMRRDAPPTETKCCHWLFYEWNGFMWHSKGRDWLAENKFPSSKYPHTQADEAMAKGVPAKWLAQGQLVEVDFEGGRYNVPVAFGNLMDAMYPEWLVPRKGGASATEYIKRVGNWADQKTWVIF